MKKSVCLFIAVTIISCFVFQAGCSSMGTRNTSQTQMIQKGITTRNEIETRLGVPSTVSLMGDGRKIIMYNYSEYRTKTGTFVPLIGYVVFGNNTRGEILQIMLDQKDVVVDHVYTDTPGAVRIR